MNTQAETSLDSKTVFRSIRVVLITLVIGLSYFNIRASLAIAGFGQFIIDSLQGKPLPGSTSFVIAAHPMFILVSIIVPCAALWIAFTRMSAKSFYILGALLFLTLLQITEIYGALSVPFSICVSLLNATP